MRSAKNVAFVVIALSLVTRVYSQVVNTGVADTTDHLFSGKLKISGYVDTYYCYDFNKPEGGDRPYFVSMNRHNEFTINLAYIDLRYSATSVRARFMPGFGTYMNANYAQEQGALKNIIEASAGVRLSAARNIWLDAGVFGSPFTNESAISKDHLAYTRSFAPEYVPYYLAGLKFTVPLSSKLNAYFYLLNGWQQINDLNKNKSIATQLEYRPGSKVLINWDTYFGNERSASDPKIGMRYFSDLYLIYTRDRWSVTSCAYLGKQQQTDQTSTWWQANLIASYKVVPQVSVTGRVEYFDDPNSVQVVPITSVAGFKCFSSSMGVNWHVTDNAMIRLEGRIFRSADNVFIRENNPVSSSNLFASNVTIWF